MEDRITRFAYRNWAVIRGLSPFSFPVVVAVSVILFFDDQTIRYPLLVFALPLFLRSAAIVLGLYDHSVSPLRISWMLSMISFAAMVTGWTLMFTFVSVIITVVF